MDLTEFLNARLDEDQAAAEFVGAWRTPRRQPLQARWRGVIEMEQVEYPLPDQLRALREIEGKRKILGRIVLELARWREFVDSEYNSYPDWDETDLLRIMAAVYSDHPEYDPAWAPG